MSSPLTACLPSLFPHHPLSNCRIISRTLSAPQFLSQSLLLGTLWRIKLPTPRLAVVIRAGKNSQTKPGRMLIQTGDSKTSRDLSITAPYSRQKFSYTEDWGISDGLVLSCSEGQPEAGSSSSSATHLWAGRLGGPGWGGQAAGKAFGPQGGSARRTYPGLSWSCVSAGSLYSAPLSLILQGHLSHWCSCEVFLLYTNLTR